MATFDFTAADAVLKEDYQPAIREQLNNSVMLLAQVDQNTGDIEGREAVFALHTGRNTGVGARTEGGSLPTAGTQSYANIRVPVKFNYGRIEVSGPVIEGMKSDRGSWTRAIDSESKGLVSDLKRDINRQLHTPSNGVIGTVVSVATNTVTFATEAEVRRQEVGQSFDFYDGDFLADDTGEIVVSRDVAAKTVTYTGLAGVDAGDWVVRSGVTMGGAAVTSKATEDALQEIHGLEDIVADSASTAGTSDGLAHPWLHGVSGAASAFWQSTVTAVGAAPTDSVFESLLDEVNLESGEDPNLIITSHAAVRAYAATLKAQKRFSNTVELKGGFSAITVQTGRGEIALWAERDTLDDVAFAVNTGCLTHWVMSDWAWMDRDGSVLSRVANTDAYEATMYKYHEFGTDARNRHGKLTGLTV